LKDLTDAALKAVSYKTTKTAYINKIAPRFGGVEGGEDVVFTGAGFGAATVD
jgi:hypothetical protein